MAAHWQPARSAYGGFDAEPQAETRIALRVAEGLPWLLLAPRTAAQVAIEPRITRVPHTRAWFRGVLSLRGSLYPVFDLGAWLGAEPMAMDPGRILIIEPGGAGAGLLLSERPALLQVRRSREPLALSDALADYVSEGFLHGAEPALAFDHRKWLAAARLDVVARQ
jgi:hypothetical protein